MGIFSSATSTGAQSREGLTPKRFWIDFCPVESTPQKFTADPHSFWENYITQNTAILDRMGQREDGQDEEVLGFRNSTGRRQAGKIMDAANLYYLSWKGTEKFRIWNQESRGWSREPQRIIPRPWSLIREHLAFAEMYFWIALHHCGPHTYISPTLIGKAKSCFPLPVTPLYDRCWGGRKIISFRVSPN